MTTLGHWAIDASLDELLADEVMQHAVRSAALTSGEFREQLRDLAFRMRRSELNGPIFLAGAVAGQPVS